jgi:hypothetical protein
MTTYRIAFEFTHITKRQFNRIANRLYDHADEELPEGVDLAAYADPAVPGWDATEVELQLAGIREDRRKRNRSP